MYGTIEKNKKPNSTVNDASFYYKYILTKKTSLVQDYSIAAKDATWCWYADPRAVYHKGKHEKIYYGYISSKGDVVISSRDANTKEIQTFILHEKLQVDDHNVPSVLFLPDGKLLTFYTEHNGRFLSVKVKMLSA